MRFLLQAWASRLPSVRPVLHGEQPHGWRCTLCGLVAQLSAHTWTCTAVSQDTARQARWDALGRDLHRVLVLRDPGRTALVTGLVSLVTREGQPLGQGRREGQLWATAFSVHPSLTNMGILPVAVSKLLHCFFGPARARETAAVMRRVSVAILLGAVRTHSVRVQALRNAWRAGNGEARGGSVRAWLLDREIRAAEETGTRDVQRLQNLTSRDGRNLRLGAGVWSGGDRQSRMNLGASELHAAMEDVLDADDDRGGDCAWLVHPFS